MRRTFWATAAVLIAAITNPVPSRAAVHPDTARCGLNEGDLCGSGFEVRRDRATYGNSCGDRPDPNLIREWREMAARCRDLARWQNAGARDVLLKLAAEYEARAERAERAPKG